MIGYIIISSLCGLLAGTLERTLARKLAGKSLVVLGDSNSGKSALLWQLGYKDNFNPNIYQQTNIDPEPERITFSKLGTSIIRNVQDTGGDRAQRRNGKYEYFIDNNDIIITVFDGNKFLKEKNIKGDYYKHCVAIFDTVAEQYKKYQNENWVRKYISQKKLFIVVASHKDEYIQPEQLRNDILKWVSGKKYECLFQQGFFGMDLHLEENKEVNKFLIEKYIYAQL